MFNICNDAVLNEEVMTHTEAKPTVGMGATKIMFSDRHPYTVIEVMSEKRIKVQEDSATRTDKNGFSESQEYTYEPNPNGTVYTLSLRKDGRWRVVGDTQVFSVGTRREYYDYTR